MKSWSTQTVWHKMRYDRIMNGVGWLWQEAYCSTIAFISGELWLKHSRYGFVSQQHNTPLLHPLRVNMWPVAPQYMVWIPYFCIIKDKVLSYHLVGRREEKTQRKLSEYPEIVLETPWIWSGNHYTMIDETWGSHSDYYHVAGQCQHFGGTCCLHLQGLKWQGKEVKGFFIGPEEQGLRAGSQ
jgi:hypothetical protein